MTTKRRHPYPPSKQATKRVPTPCRAALAPPPQPSQNALLALQNMVQTRATLLVDGVDYVWDFANRKAVPESHMPIGSARYQASEHARFQAFREHFREVLQAAASETDKAD